MYSGKDRTPPSYQLALPYYVPTIINCHHPIHRRRRWIGMVAVDQYPPRTTKLTLIHIYSSAAGRHCPAGTAGRHYSTVTIIIHSYCNLIIITFVILDNGGIIGFNESFATVVSTSNLDTMLPSFSIFTPVPRYVDSLKSFNTTSIKERRPRRFE